MDIFPERSDFLQFLPLPETSDIYAVPYAVERVPPLL
jgi:hypothetical protein